MKRILSLVLALVLAVSLCEAAPAARAVKGGKLIAITFDDGPSIYTTRLLDGLKARNAKATFFIVGSRVNTYAATVARAYREGHQIANHSYDHANLVNLSDSGVANQIQRTNALLNQAIGQSTTYLVRAPYGSANARVRAAVGAPLVMWSVDPVDWRDRNAATVRSRIVSQARDGAVILVHDLYSTSVTGALEAISDLQAQGYEFVTVRELFRRRGVTMQNGVSYNSCRPNGTDMGPVTAPTFASRVVDGKLEITLRAQPGAAIYYSLSGSDVSTQYTGPFTVSPPCTVWAMAAYHLNGSRSDVAQQAFDKPAARSPEIDITDGVLTLTNQTAGTEVFYTLEGATTTDGAAAYAGPVTLAPGTAVRAWAQGGNYLTSAISRAAYSDRCHFFRDVFPGDWYYDAMDQAVSAGLVGGVGNASFAPGAPVTRGQLVTMLYRYSGEEVTEEERAACPLTDLAAGSYYEDAVCWAYARALVNGYEGDVFRPDRPISRQEISCILVRFLESVRDKAFPAGVPVQEYTDGDDTAPWAVDAVEKLTACGLMRGDDKGAFRPAAQASRAEAATVLMRLAEVESALPDAPPAPVEDDPAQEQPDTPACVVRAWSSAAGDDGEDVAVQNPDGLRAFLEGLDYQPHTNDGLPEYEVLFSGGDTYSVNLSAGWVWRGGESQADLSEELLAELRTLMDMN